jgi:hypothetical protein
VVQSGQQHVCRRLADNPGKRLPPDLRTVQLRLGALHGPRQLVLAAPRQLIVGFGPADAPGVSLCAQPGRIYRGR